MRQNASRKVRNANAVEHKEKVEAIMALHPPRNVRQVRSLLGLINFYKSFIGKRSATLGPITELTKKGVIFQ